ncbi:MAG: PAS domain S-box protein [Candidatus Hydrogenedentes bacterium]|nr:PAS domain S-box protein [Candidatus Hydrogenedentota bacterium]
MHPEDSSMLRFGLVLLLAQLISQVSLGAESAIQADFSKHVQVFLPSDGLAGEVVRSIAKTPDGNVWFACWGRGIARADGYTWTSYQEESGLPTNDVRALLLDVGNRLWCGSSEGIAYFNAGQWRIVSTGLPGLDRPSIFQTCQLSNGAIWFITARSQIVQFAPSSPQYAPFSLTAPGADPDGVWSVVPGLERFASSPSITDVLPLPNKEVWVGLRDVGIVTYGADDWRLVWEEAEERMHGLTLTRTTDGAVWAAGGRDLVRYENGQRTVIHGLGETITSLGAGTRDTLWVGTDKGLRSYDGRWGWRSVGPNSKADVGLVNSILCTGPNEVWVGTRSGACRITDTVWSLCNSDEKGASIVSICIYAEPEFSPVTVDIGGTIYRWEENHWKSLVSLGERGEVCLGMSRPRDDRCWVLFKERLVEVSLGSSTALRSLTLPHLESTPSVYCGPTGRLFLCGSRHIYEFTDGAWSSIREHPIDSPSSLMEDHSGTLWAIWPEDAERCKGGIWTSLGEGPLAKQSRSLEVITEAQDDTVLLGIADLGILSFSDDHPRRVCSFEGASFSQLSALLQCQNGMIWTGHRGSGISSYMDGLWLDYGPESGIAEGRVRYLGEDPEGTVWAFVAGAGPFRYRPNPGCPAPKIEHSPKSVAPGDRGIFKFSGKDKWNLTEDADLRFSWRILLEKDSLAASSWSAWSPWSAETVVVAPRLAPDRYALQLRAVNLDRNTQVVPSEVSFEVLGPFWSSPAFYLPVGGLALVVVALSAAWVRKHRLLAESETKHRTILDTISEIIFSLSPEAIIAYVSPGIERVLGYCPSDVVGQPVSNLMDPRDRARFQDHLANLARQGDLSDEYRFVARCGVIQWLRVSCHASFEDGRVVDIKGVATDITNRKNAEETLRTTLENLEYLVAERTREVTEANTSMREEIQMRARTESALRESESKYRNLVENVPQRIYIKDCELRYVSCNERFAADLKLSPDSIAGKSDFDFFPIELAENYRKDDQAVITSGQLAEVEEIYLLDGEERWIHTTKAPVRNSAGTVIGVLGIFWDITDQKRAEDELARYRGHLEEMVRARTAELDNINAQLQRELVERRLAEKKLQEYADTIHDLYDHAPCGYHSLDGDGTFIHINDTELRWLGYSREEIEQNKKFGDIMTAESRKAFCTSFSEFKERGWAKDVEFTIVRKDGSLLPVVVNSTAIKNSAGDYVMSRTTVFDLTERKRLEEKLRTTMSELALAKDEAEAADRLKSAFLATMSHELRTPLNSIIGFAGILHQELVGPLNPEQKKQLGMVRDSSGHLLSLINDILDISKIEAGQLHISMDSFDLRALIDRVIQTTRPLAEKKKLALDAIVNPKVSCVTSDRRRVEQVLLNLLSNAIKFTERGSIRTECEPRDGHVIIQIVDTGIGIRPENMELLFKPFQQVDSLISRQYEGTGLGLSICKKLVERLGGKIWAESEWGRGTVVSFTIPIGGGTS